MRWHANGVRPSPTSQNGQCGGDGAVWVRLVVELQAAPQGIAAEAAEAARVRSDALLD